MEIEIVNYRLIYSLIYSLLYSLVYIMSTCKRMLYLLLPDVIFIKEHCHFNFTVKEYLYIKNNKNYRKKFINEVDIDIDVDIDKRRITHCGMLDKNEEYIRDLTEDIRMFMHYHCNDKIKWEYILIHLGIDIKKEGYIIINLNDNDLTEKCLNITQIYDKPFVI